MSMHFAVYIARAFCHHSLGGKRTGVIVSSPEFSYPTVQMQTIAKELNLSETVSILPLKRENIRKFSIIDFDLK